MSKGNKEAKKPKQLHPAVPQTPVLPAAGASLPGRPAQTPKPGKR